MLPISQELIDFLNRKVEEYNQPRFIRDDPISVPHLFTKTADIEIAGFFAAIFSWGNRTTIIQKSRELMNLMDNDPHAFILEHTSSDLKKLFDFKHRTFTTTDLLYFIEFLHHHYKQFPSLEDAFLRGLGAGDSDIAAGLDGFHHYFFSMEEVPARTRKHIAAPFRNSSCKRLNMYLRWMVRANDRGVDFGLWKRIRPAQLICPMDLHVARVALRFGLLQRETVDWKAALDLTQRLRELDPQDPVKYDFALFALGLVEKY